MHSEKIPTRVIASIVAIGLLSFCGILIETAMNIAFPTLMREFKIPTNVVQYLTSLNLLIISIVIPLSAYLKRNFKTKHLFLTANLLLLIGLLVGGFAPIFPLLLLGRIIQGIAAGIALPLMFNIIMEQVPSQKLGLMMGIGQMILGVAPALGPTFGGIITDTLGWRWIFFLLIPIVLISLILGLTGIQQKSAVHREPLDLLSLALIACCFCGLILGCSNFSSQPFWSWSVSGLLGLGLLGLIGWIYRTQKIDNPILNLALLKNHFVAGHVAIYFFLQLISIAITFLLPNYAQLVNGASPMIAGLVMLPAGFAGAAANALGGKALDRWGARKPILFGSAFVLLELIIFAIIAKNMSNVTMAIQYTIYLAGLGFVWGNTLTDTLSNLPAKQHEQGNALMNTSQQFAGSVGVALVSTIVAFKQRQAGTKYGLPTALGTQYSFWVLLVIGLICGLLIIRFEGQGKKHNK
ncbi:MAG: MFS transporter [Lactobacillus sp.]|jgi:EmrB/QacA subfamily drug resistance transporter|nr:MFS transporter [Lactobacillus sp.]MCH3905919.1 MFS transporter [Lactobacillus sp.]MCH3990507.1 MFS transporter [Lactobacillus sp.]MCH4068778.1 MFS transporter [Lactobacillus sp.]MCI1303737.1 MFS transporter [Lactobacillus sp.]